VSHISPICWVSFMLGVTDQPFLLRVIILNTIMLTAVMLCFVVPRVIWLAESNLLIEDYSLPLAPTKMLRNKEITL
jgi:hypothetical protein